MDKIIQLVIVMMISLSGYAQCTDSIQVYSDSCGARRVTSSIELFTELYLCKKNLDILSKEGLNVKKVTDSLHRAARRDRYSFERELKVRDYKTTVLETSLDKANEVIIDLSLDNAILKEDLIASKKKQKKLLLVGGLSGFAACFLISTL